MSCPKRSKPAPQRGKHRKKRPRRPLPGMLLFQDGSTHRWVGALGHDLDLIVTLDDATGCITSAFLIEEEGTMSSVIGLHGRCRPHGYSHVRNLHPLALMIGAFVACAAAAIGGKMQDECERLSTWFGAGGSDFDQADA